MNTPDKPQSNWLKSIQNKVLSARTKNSPFSHESIVKAAENNLQSYLKRVEKKLINHVQKGHKIFVQISDYSEYRIMFFYTSKDSVFYRFLSVPHRHNKIYDLYSSANQETYNNAYLAAARRELRIEVDTTNYLQLPF